MNRRNGISTRQFGFGAPGNHLLSFLAIYLCFRDGYKICFAPEKHVDGNETMNKKLKVLRWFEDRVNLLKLELDD